MRVCFPNKPRSFCIAVGVLLCLQASMAQSADSFTDPAPPQVASVKAVDAPKPAATAELTFHRAPKPLAKDAVTHDWPGFLGPNHNATSSETRLLAELPKAGPPAVWEYTKGSGYAAPAISGDDLILFHRVDNNETVDCLHRETGQRRWRHQYAVEYQDRYGYSDGPRCSPVIADGRVFTYGVAGALHCIDLASGQVIWSRGLLSEFKIEQNFFGVGATPLVEGNLLIINIGAAGGPCVAAFDVKSGRMMWGAGKEWGPSYASPIPATIHGKRRVLVFAGGESRPATGGLLCIDPANGKVDFTFPWRGRRFESVNASSPLVIGNQVFISECYGKGGVLLEIAADFTVKPLWTSEDLGTHFMTAIHKDGHIYGYHGHGPQNSPLVCVNAKTGETVWSNEPAFTETIKTEQGERQLRLGMDRAQLLMADGKAICLSEWGHLLYLDLNPTAYKELSRSFLFAAPESWTGPVLSRGLLYICQNQTDRLTRKEARVICYDLRM